MCKSEANISWKTENSFMFTFSSFLLVSDREDSSRIFVAVGYGFYLEMTHDEALQFIEKKTSQLTASVHAKHTVFFFCGFVCAGFSSGSLTTIRVCSSRDRDKTPVGWAEFQLCVSSARAVSGLWVGDANYANTVCFRHTEQLTKDSAKIKANIRMVLEVSSKLYLYLNHWRRSLCYWWIPSLSVSDGH